MEGKESKEETSGVTVVEHENRRELPISHFPKEVEQLCKDVCSFFKTLVDGKSGESKTELDSRYDEDDIPSPSPKTLNRLYKNLQTNASDVWLYEYRLLELHEIKDCGNGSMRERGLIPFARNIDGEFLACGENEHDGGVYEVDEDDEKLIGDSLATYLEQYRDNLLSSKLEFIEGIGMVECTCDSNPVTSLK